MGLGAELIQRIERALAAKDGRALEEIAKWARTNFRFESSKTPRGQKDLKAAAQRFFGSLTLATGLTEDGWKHTAEWWKSFKRDVPSLVLHFSAEGDQARGKKEQVVELKLSHATYFNRSGMAEATFRKYAKAVEETLASLKGWRTKALNGNLKVVFVGSQMRVQGKYREALDEMWVKATPKVLKRSGGTYGSPEYILVHELGHRYERFNSLPTVGFGRDAVWRTTRYSWNDGEDFAELFALGHFNIRGQWGEKLDLFEKTMAGKTANIIEVGRCNHQALTQWWEQKATDLTFIDAGIAARVAAEYTKGKPSYPHRTDRAQPTNANLWDDVLNVASGRRNELSIGDRTIHAPNEGRGFSNMPQNPQGISWAVKQYKGFGGGWKEARRVTVEFQNRAGRILDAGGIMAVPLGNEQERLWMARLAHTGYAEKIGENERETLWVRTGTKKISDQGILFLSKLSNGIKGKFDLDAAKGALEPLGFKFEDAVAALPLDYFGIKKVVNQKHPELPWDVTDSSLISPRRGAAAFETETEALKALKRVQGLFTASPPKGPARPKKGELYAYWKSTRVRPGFDKSTFELEWVVKVWVGVPSLRITSPKGVVLDIPTLDRDLRKNTSSASFWTFIYKKCEGQALAQAKLQELGEGAIEAAKPQPKNPRGLANTGTCGVCEQNVKLSKGRIMRHGWKVQGSRWKGSYGNSWHSGPCFGVNYEPWEVSSRSAKDFLKHLQKAVLPVAEARLGQAKLKPDVLVVRDFRSQPQEFPRGEEKTATRFKYDEAWGKRLASAEEELKAVKDAIQFFETRIQGWKAQPLPGK